MGCLCLESSPVRRGAMRNVVRALFALALLAPVVIWFEDFAQHFVGYLSGNAITVVIKRQWHVALASMLFFIAFLIPLTWRRKARWAEYGMVAAFFVSLFIEMFGIPLTLLFASRFIPTPAMDLPQNAVNFNAWGVGMGLSVPMLYGLVLTISGLALIVVGWVQLYRAVKTETVVTSGVYALSRHPQYVGFLLVLMGWLVGWPTILTVVMAPLLMVQYVRVCLKEEAELDTLTYSAYRSSVPMFL